jgi:hypothetical protein
MICFLVQGPIPEIVIRNNMSFNEHIAKMRFVFKAFSLIQHYGDVAFCGLEPISMTVMAC